MITRKITQWLAVLPGVILLLALFIIKPFESYTLFPGNSGIDITANDDRLDGGNSKIIDYRTTVDNIHIKYIIGQKLPYPYVNANFTNQRGGSLDLSGYDHVKVKVSSTAPLIRFFLTARAKSLEERKKVEGYHWNKIIMEYPLKSLPGLMEYRIPLKEFRIDVWWYAMQKINLNYEDEADLANFLAFQIGHSYPTSGGTVEETLIKEVTFYRDDSLFLICGSTPICLFYAIFLFRYLKKKKQKNKKLILNDKNSEACKLFNYLNNHYMEESIDPSLVSINTGLKDSKIHSIMKKYSNEPFNFYINNLRIREARRLLTETDLRISEIASLVGFKSSSYFNRLFHEQMTVTPKDYRSRNDK